MIAKVILTETVTAGTLRFINSSTTCLFSLKLSCTLREN